MKLYIQLTKTILFSRESVLIHINKAYVISDSILLLVEIILTMHVADLYANLYINSLLLQYIIKTMHFFTQFSCPNFPKLYQTPFALKSTLIVQLFYPISISRLKNAVTCAIYRQLDALE